MKRRVALSTSLLTVVIATLLATSASATKWECGERANLPTEGKNYCAAGDFRQAAINLKKVLSAVLKNHKVAFGDTTALSNAQSAFETYRDNQCRAENKRIEDKAFHSMIVAQCKSRITNLRINELKRML